VAYGDQPKFYPIEHGFDEMKSLGRLFPGVYTYDDTEIRSFVVPEIQPPAYGDEYQKSVKCSEWERYRRQTATKVARIDLRLSCMSLMFGQADSAVEYIQAARQTPRTPKAVSHGVIS